MGAAKARGLDPRKDVPAGISAVPTVTERLGRIEQQLGHLLARERFIDSEEEARRDRPLGSLGPANAATVSPQASIMDRINILEKELREVREMGHAAHSRCQDLERSIYGGGAEAPLIANARY